MSDASLSAFHEHLLRFLQKELLQKMEIEGWNEKGDPEFCGYRDALSLALRDVTSSSLQDLISKHTYLFQNRGVLHLEHRLLEAFPERELRAHHLPILKMYRGLPRLYQKSMPSISRLKPNFGYLPALKRSLAAKYIASLYSQIEIGRGFQVAILAYSLPDGRGDIHTALAAAEVLLAVFPEIDLHLFLYQKEEVKNRDFPIELWTGSEAQLHRLRRSQFILQLPVYFSESHLLYSQVNAIDAPIPLPKWEWLGEYGFLESEWFHPRTQRHCMGLHFLERGLLLPPQKAPAKDWDHPHLASWIDMRKEGPLFFAYLYSYAGVFTYFHAMLKSQEGNDSDLFVCVPDAEKFCNYVDERLQKEEPIFDRSYGLREIVLQIDHQKARWPVASEGKTLFIFSAVGVTSSDFQKLLLLSEDFVGCRGDRSFSEVVCARKGFFYDPRDHSRYFLRDLVAIAENRLASYPSTLAILRLFLKLLEHNLSPDDGIWTDEMGIQRADEPMPLLDIAEQIGAYLGKPDVVAGFKELHSILIQEHACNSFLSSLVQKTFYQQQFPQLVYQEEEEILHFSQGKRTIIQSIQLLKDLL